MRFRILVSSTISLFSYCTDLVEPEEDPCGGGEGDGEGSGLRTNKKLLAPAVGWVERNYQIAVNSWLGVSTHLHPRGRVPHRWRLRWRVGVLVAADAGTVALGRAAVLPEAKVLEEKSTMVCQR